MHKTSNISHITKLNQCHCLKHELQWKPQVFWCCIILDFEIPCTDISISHMIWAINNTRTQIIVFGVIYHNWLSVFYLKVHITTEIGRQFWAINHISYNEFIIFYLWPLLGPWNPTVLLGQAVLLIWIPKYLEMGSTDVISSKKHQGNAHQFRWPLALR